MHLDKRLSLAFELYDTCDLAADIGTDHAHLPIALLEAGKCRRMLLTEISEGAMSNARNNIIRARLTDRVAFLLGDGLEPVREPCGMISILGMGGKTIRGILEHGKDRLRGASLLLSAHTDLAHVRQAVMETGYRLVSETPCYAAGRYYLILKAEPGEEILTPQEIRVGKRLIQGRSPVLLSYLKHQQSVQQAKLKGLRSTVNTSPALLRQTETDVDYYLKTIERLEKETSDQNA